jgi:glycolate oxidase
MHVTISDDAFAALQAAVGQRFASRDAAMVFGNSWNSGVGTNAGQGKLPDAEHLPVAVVLPSTTEEVAAVVKACNRHKLNYRAFSTGWGNMGGVSRPNSVGIDLRRMNRCEIDAENQMAVIEPFVTAGQLMADAMKHGLTTHVVGAGATHSPLASATSFWGIGISGATTGHNVRNLLSIEWVTPQGEIVRLGSVGSDAGWFTGDGPGPSFRGMIRGFIGNAGGLGVFTRIGYRLHPWHGPPQLEFTGRHPQIGLKMDGTRMRFYQAVWPSWEGVQQAAFEFNVAAVTTVQLRMPPEHIALTLTTTNNEYLQKINTDELPAVARQENGCSWSILTTAYSDKQAAYNDKVVRQIVERSGGRFLEVEPAHEEVLARNLATSCFIPRVLRPGNDAATSFGIADSLHVLPRTIEAGKALYADADLAKTYFHTVGTEQNWVWPTERRSVWSENIVGLRPAVGKGGDAERTGAYLEALLYQNYLIETRRCGVEAFCVGPGIDLSGPNWGPNAHVYSRQVKNTYDPQNLSDPLFNPAKAEAIGGVYQIAKKFLFKPAIRPLLRKLAQGMAKKM